MVNALEVLDRAISSRPTIAIDRAMQGRACLARDLIEARAAVAELIEVVRKVAAYDAAPGYEAAVLSDNRRILSAALARVSGGAA